MDPFVSSFSALEADIFSGDQMLSPPWPELAPPASNANSSGGSGSRRKLSHNAYERDRRKELNELYSSLRSLLPNDDHTKKMSIPTTVCRVLKYIPELQKQVENLERKKKELTKAKCKPEIMNTTGNMTPVVSANCPNGMEIVVQVSLLCNVAATTLPLSKCIEVLESEGLHLISSLTYSTFENRTFCTLQLQRSERVMDKECPAFCDQLQRILRNKAEM